MSNILISESPQQLLAPEPLPTLILGGGFTGLFTALHLSRQHYTTPTILIDREWNFIFKPLLYEFLSGEMNMQFIRHRYDALLHKIARIAQIQRLRQDLGLNLVGAAIVLDMAQELAQLRLQQIPIKPATKQPTEKAQSRCHNDETN